LTYQTASHSQACDEIIFRHSYGNSAVSTLVSS